MKCLTSGVMANLPRILVARQEIAYYWPSLRQRPTSERIAKSKSTSFKAASLARSTIEDSSRLRAA
jgi:hypothetical protein